MKTIEEIIKTARTHFQNRLRLEDQADAETIATEIAKNSVPSSSKEILVLALRNLEMALEVPARGPAFDGRPTAINLIAANVREMVYQNLVNPKEPAVTTDLQTVHDDLMRQLETIHESFYTKNLYQGVSESREES